MKATNNQFDVLEAEIKQDLLLIEQEAVLTAQSFAHKNLPSLVGDKMKRYFGEMHYKLQQRINDVEKVFRCDFTRHSVIEEEKKKIETIKNYRNEIEDFGHETVQKKRELAQLPPSMSETKLKLINTALIIMFLFEGLFTPPALEYWGLSYIHALIGGFFFAGIVAIVVHISKKLLWSKISSRLKSLLACAIFAIMSAIFWYLSMARAQHLTNATTDDSGIPLFTFDPFSIFAFSLTLFIGAVALSAMCLPKEEEKTIMREKRNINKTIKSLEKQIALKKQQIANTNDTFITFKNNCIAILDRGNKLEKSILHRTGEFSALWIRHNRKYRTDNGWPSCFDEPYPFQFTTYFHALNSPNHENIS